MLLEDLQWPKYVQDGTINRVLYFPIEFNSTLTIIGVGFTIYNITRQSYTFTETYLSTSSEITTSGTHTYLAIGI